MTEQLLDSKIKYSVGDSAINYDPDVLLIQKLLNNYGAALKEDGKIGKISTQAIHDFQKKMFNGWSSGVVEPGSKTIKVLREDREHHPEERFPETEHFKIDDFKCKNGTLPLPAMRKDLDLLMQQLEVLRAALGGHKIYIKSGFRTPSYNSTMGGLETSEHLKAKAAHLSMGNISPLEISTKILALIESGQMLQGGLGLHDDYVHYDIRGTEVRWDKRTPSTEQPKVEGE